MDIQKLIAGIILFGLGTIFFLNSKKIGEGAHEFYKKFYTPKNLAVIFKIVGILLIIGSLLLILIE